MRMRKKPNLEPRLAKCAEVIVEPENAMAMRGAWLSHFEGYNALRLEIGCGKGRFTADTAVAEPDILLVALEKVADAMVTATERVCERGIGNVKFINDDASRLKEMFGDGELERIYINFCDPWPKSRDAKFRLTAPGFLRMYADLLAEGGQIHFKTDNTPLFCWSVEQFEKEGWKLIELTNDLHANGPVGVMTDYEAKFYSAGLKINRVVAIKCESTKGTSAGAVPRIHNASLTDARGYEASMNSHKGEEA